MRKYNLPFFILLFNLLIHAKGLHSQGLQMLPTVGLGSKGIDFSIEIPIAKKFIIEPAIGLGQSYDFSNRDGMFPKLGTH